MISVLKRIGKHEGVKRYARNSGWLLVEHFFKAVVAIAVGFYVGRYLGPEKFGVLNYLMSIMAFVGAVARLGLDGVVVRELLEDDFKNKEIILGTSFWMQVSVGIILCAVFSFGVYKTESDINFIVYVAFLSLGSVLQSFNFVDWYFQSKVQSGVAVKCRVISTVVATLAKLLAISISADLYVFFGIYALEFFVLSVLYAIIAVRYDIGAAFSSFSASQVKKYLSAGWPLILSAVAVTVYTKIDQVMIRSMMSDFHVGIYSAAVKFYEAWAAVPYLLSISFLPAIKRAREMGAGVYERRLIYFFRGMFWSSVFVGGCVAAAAERIILLAYGEMYMQAAEVLGVVMMTASWTALGNCSARYFIAEHKEKYILMRTLFAAFINVALNYIFIPKFGISGAAYATLISMFVANYLLDWTSKDLRQLRKIKNKAIFFVG